MILAIDTATRFISLALHDGKRLLLESTWLTANNHSTELSPAIRAAFTSTVTPQPSQSGGRGRGPGPRLVHGSAHRHGRGERALRWRKGIPLDCGTHPGDRGGSRAARFCRSL
ncbi:MAG: hypothetical protein KatS3mg051_0292 [Anaerolineae bacterium]|nr:MAG: hypothetical protein KatS3mg051_0292 [Anaerolineae bacterium]